VKIDLRNLSMVVLSIGKFCENRKFSKKGVLESRSFVVGLNSRMLNLVQ
jgi:hypothetical protein